MLVEKECFILVGPQGSGKTEIANNIYNRYKDIGCSIVSQDNQGKSGHVKNFKALIKDGMSKIVIDRINHTKQQRDRYIEPAKEHGYVITIIDITTDPTTCFNRIIKRKEHPSIPFNDKDIAIRALYTYYSGYDKPLKEECDNLNDCTDFNPNFLDLTQTLKGKKYFIVGDIHGCFDEFTQMLVKSKASYVVSVGDLIDKGPKIMPVLQYFMKNKNSYSCMGNHENKFLRYLIGNKVNTESLKETIEQTKEMDKYELALFIMSMPKMIKESNNYIFHAGLNPEKSIENQHKEALLYARKFDTITKGFNDKPGLKYWHEYIKESNIEHKNTCRFFGHHYHSNTYVSHNTFAMDGHCVYGKELRAMVMPKKELILLKASKVYKDPINSTSYVNEHLEHYERHVSMGYISKSEKEDLVLYKYTKKCVYDKVWNEYTRKARGIIFNRKTGECVARPYEKFFNIGELPETEIENLPKGGYKLYDKLDGSLGILYWHNGKPLISTCGSFNSEQAIEANKILKEKGYYDKLMSNHYPFSRTLTLLFEIIYPENKIVCDYNGKRDLFLTGAIDRITGQDYDIYGIGLKNYLDYLNFPRAIQYTDASLESAINSKGTITKDKEGWVYRNENGFRVKVKGDEYLRIHKLISGISPLFLWDSMNKGNVSTDTIKDLPEEFKKEVLSIKGILENNYKLHKTDMLFEIDLMLKKIGLGNIEDINYRKKLGLYLKDNNVKHRSMFFPYLTKNNKVIDTYIMKKIRPKGNKL